MAKYAALGLWAEADLARSVCCTAQRPWAGIFRHIQSITYKYIRFNLVDYIAKKWHFPVKISKIRRYMEAILSETNDDLSYI